MTAPRPPALGTGPDDAYSRRRTMEKRAKAAKVAIVAPPPPEPVVAAVQIQHDMDIQDLLGLIKLVDGTVVRANPAVPSAVASAHLGSVLNAAWEGDTMEVHIRALMESDEKERRRKQEETLQRIRDAEISMADKWAAHLVEFEKRRTAATVIQRAVRLWLYGPPPAGPDVAAVPHPPEPATDDGDAVQPTAPKRPARQLRRAVTVGHLGKGQRKATEKERGRERGMAAMEAAAAAAAAAAEAAVAAAAAAAAAVEAARLRLQKAEEQRLAALAAAAAVGCAAVPAAQTLAGQGPKPTDQLKQHPAGDETSSGWLSPPASQPTSQSQVAAIDTQQLSPAEVTPQTSSAQQQEVNTVSLVLEESHGTGAPQHDDQKAKNRKARSLPAGKRSLSSSHLTVVPKPLEHEATVETDGTDAAERLLRDFCSDQRSKTPQQHAERASSRERHNDKAGSVKDEEEPSVRGGKQHHPHHGKLAHGLTLAPSAQATGFDPAEAVGVLRSHSVTLLGQGGGSRSSTPQPSAPQSYSGTDIKGGLVSRLPRVRFSKVGNEDPDGDSFHPDSYESSVVARGCVSLDLARGSMPGNGAVARTSFDVDHTKPTPFQQHRMSLSSLDGRNSNQPSPTSMERISRPLSRGSMTDLNGRPTPPASPSPGQGAKASGLLPPFGAQSRMMNRSRSMSQVQTHFFDADGEEETEPFRTLTGNSGWQESSLFRSAAAPLNRPSLDRAPSNSATLDRAPSGRPSLDKPPSSWATLDNPASSKATLDRAPSGRRSIEASQWKASALPAAPTIKAHHPLRDAVFLPPAGGRYEDDVDDEEEEEEFDVVPAARSKSMPALLPQLGRSPPGLPKAQPCAPAQGTWFAAARKS